MKYLVGGQRTLCFVSVFFLAGYCLVNTGYAKQGMSIKSKAFENGAEIPLKYTCEGSNLTIPLQWSNVPSSTKSLVLVVDDPDAPNPERPKMVWVHWVLYDIPVTVTSLSEGPRDAALPKGVRQGMNSWKKKSWGGPCPPMGRHRYFFKLFALDRLMGDLHTPNEKELMKAIDGHVLEKAELVGTYMKKTKKK